MRLQARAGSAIPIHYWLGAAPPAPSGNASPWSNGDRRGSRPSSSLEGAVKWFEPDKGYGFISPDGGGKDVFIHITALRRSGLDGLTPGQRVRVEVIDGRKGLEADQIALI